MNALDKKLLADMVRDYPIHDLLDVLRDTIEAQVDELVDVNEGHPPSITKEMSRVAYHLSIFARS